VEFEVYTSRIYGLKSVHVTAPIINTEANVVQVNVKQSRYRRRGFQEVKVPRFLDNGTGWW
jgi:hypothetical protein